MRRKGFLDGDTEYVFEHSCLGFVYGQKSEDKFLDRMASMFGSDAVIAYGDWSRSSSPIIQIQIHQETLKKIFGAGRQAAIHFQKQAAHAN